MSSSKKSENKPVEFNLKNPVHFLALGFGSGLLPKAPGTYGTLAAIPLFLLMSELSTMYYALVVLLSCIIGVYLCGRTAEDVGVHDHGAIVWDEFAGFFITMFMIPVSWQSVLVGFMLFRLFDIIKPWPISVADKKLSGGFGIMFDDILAGFFALAIMHIIF
ncbi:phosphatidylglycerophosphatase A [Colwellia asteriadis]|uniref:Phosphatidylglycerophosphatase A n=1 Tax=Colwellia asteriadis TaxID=517723 RepID=A0ABP3WF58_9GAMM